MSVINNYLALDIILTWQAGIQDPENNNKITVAEKVLSFASLITSYICFGQDWICVQFLLLSTLPAPLLSFMISMAAAITSKGDVPGQEQPALVWDMQLVFDPVAPPPCTPSLLIAQMYPFYYLC